MTNTTTKDERLAMKFPTKKEAQAAVRKIYGYCLSDVRQIVVMGFYLWAICDDHMNYLTREGYESILRDKEGQS